MLPSRMEGMLIPLSVYHCCECAWRFEHDDWDGGTADVIATMVLGRHIGRGKISATIHLGCQIETIAIGTLAFYAPRMPERGARAPCPRTGLAAAVHTDE